jgi:hypothetical protein
MLKDMPEGMHEELMNVMLNDTESNKIILQGMQSAMAPVMPKRSGSAAEDYFHYSVKKSEGYEREDVRRALQMGYPADLDDFIKYAHMPEAVGEAFHSFKSSAKDSHHTENLKQILSHISLDNLSRAKQTEGGVKPAKGAVESSLYLLKANAMSGKLPNSLLKEIAFQEDWEKGKEPFLVHSLDAVASEIEEFFGYRVPLDPGGMRPISDKKQKQIIEERKRRKGKSPAYAWYSSFRKEANKDKNKKVLEEIRKESQESGWYKTAKDKAKNSKFEYVYVSSNADIMTLCSNIYNNTPKNIQNKAAILMFVPFEEFGSLANINKFNKSSTLTAKALTREECKLLRSLNVIG